MSGLGGDLDKQAITAYLERNSALLKPMKDRFRNKYDALVDRCSGLPGRPHVSRPFEGREGATHGRCRRGPDEADDDVLVNWGHLLSQQYRALGASSAEQCYRYASGVGWIGDLAKMLPDGPTTERCCD